MNNLKGNCLLAQSGGPTSVINSSAYGIIKEFVKSANGKTFIGAYGIEGILRKQIYDVDNIDKGTLEGMKYMPASALGSCRYKLKDFRKETEEYDKLFDIFRELNIKYFFYIGGNDSMDAAAKIGEYAKFKNYDIKVIGIPKTIDNDLVETDHCPGFGSAAKYVSNVAMELWLDINTYTAPSIMVLEVMGRDAGWIAASTGLIKENIPWVNQLIYIPEISFSEEKFLNDVSESVIKNNKLLIVTSEGLKDDKKKYINVGSNCYESDQFGHKQLGGVGKYLQQLIKNNIHNKVKFTELGVSQRCAMHCVSKVDIEESELVGREAVRQALQGNSGYMIAIKRTNDSEYSSFTELVPLNIICNKVKEVPIDWMNSRGNNIGTKMREYVLPLIKGEINSYSDNGMLKCIDINKLR